MLFGWSWFFLHLPLFQSLFQALEDYFKSTNYYYYHLPQLFQIFGKIQVFVSSHFLLFSLCGLLEKQVSWWHFLFSLLINTRYCLLVSFMWSVYISETQRILCISFSRTDYALCIYHLVEWSKFNLLHNSQFTYTC